MQIFKLRLLIFFFLFSLFFGCATFQKIDFSQKEKLLSAHLKEWENIQIDGIIELNYRSFSFRKNIVIKKTGNLGRIDIFDSGVFGLKPNPFISAYFDSTLFVRFPEQTKFVEINNSSLKRELPDLSFIKIFDELVSNKNKILEEKKYRNNDFIFYFSDEMKLEKIELAQEKFCVLFDYSKELSKILIFKNSKEIANIQIDKISHKNIEITNDYIRFPTY
ncbi:MAG: hypothetical protein KAW88_08570 [Candidatus Cloacimonetes bacterium]|nr:hypothetical protein [Candidatus Cloacimonadota bacterium]